MSLYDPTGADTTDGGPGGDPSNIHPPPGWVWDAVNGRWVPPPSPPSDPGPPTNTTPTGTDPTPPPAAPPPGGGAGPSSIGRPPTFTAPNLPNISPFSSGQNPYEYQPFDNSPYTISPFKAPTLQDAQSEPGYEFARKEGIRALENANLPTLRSGGTLKNLIGWGDRFAEQNYGNVYNRAANTYGINENAILANRNNAFGANQANNTGRLNQFTTNFDASRDTWDRNTSLAEKLYEMDLQGRQIGFNGSMQEWLAKLNSLTQIGTAGANGA